MQVKVQSGHRHFVWHHHWAGLCETCCQLTVADDPGHPLHSAAHHRAEKVGGDSGVSARSSFISGGVHVSSQGLLPFSQTNY